MKMIIEVDGKEAEELIALMVELREVLEDVRESLCIQGLQQDSEQEQLDS